MGNMTILTLLYVGGGLVQSGGITIGELTSFLMYTAYAGSSLFGLSSFYSELMKGVGAASRLFELEDREPKISPTKGEKVESAHGPIRFENVSFSYPTRPAVSIFRGLNFEIPQGSNVAIVGPSGGGKSTIGALLLRFYNPSQGRILIGGKDISKMNAKSLRRKVGVVSQEPVLFSGTIAENIAYGKPEATRWEIVAAARKANCQFISDFVSFQRGVDWAMADLFEAGWPRYTGWTTRCTALRWTEATNRHRAGPNQESRHLNPRRSNLCP